jgi:hypothetical protein
MDLSTEVETAAPRLRSAADHHPDCNRTATCSGFSCGAVKLAACCISQCYGFRVTAAEADDLLDGLPLVPAVAGSLAEMKSLRERCLAADIPALVGCPPGAGKG